jgi:DNA-binding response OmpR family regulator
VDNTIKILIVDDDPLISGTLDIILKCYGYKATIVNNGYSALNAVRLERFHIALLDIGMPEMNGIELMVELGRLSTHTRIVMMTAYDKYHPLVKQAIAAKPDRLLYKPIDPATLVEIIRYYERIFECTDPPPLE